MNGLQISIPQRMVFVKVVLVVSTIISLLLSLPVWAGYRDFPYSPLLPLPALPAPYDYSLIVVLILVLLAALFLRRERLLLFLAFLISVYLVLCDLNRLQPWFYLYSVMLLLFVFYNGRVDDPNKYTSYFIILQLMLASLYFFCGLSQINPLFTQRDFQELIAPLQGLMSERQFAFFNRLGAAVPYILMFIGIGLIVSPVRYLAITLAVFMHVLLLVFLFPSSKNQNYALWFSNLSCIFLLLLLFSGKTKQRYYSPTFLLEVPFFYPVVLLFLVMPVLNTANRWPDFLSFNFRSGNSNSALISVSMASAEEMPLYLRSYCEPNYTFMTFNYERWCREELHVDCYPEEPVFREIYQYLKSTGGADVKEIELRLVPKQKLLLKR